MMKKFNILVVTQFILLTACASVDDAKKVLKNEKIRTTDEFLVKKKEPLELPPDFSEIPKPDSISKKDKSINDEEKIKKILKAPNQKNVKSKSNSSIEQSILEKISK